MAKTEKQMIAIEMAEAARYSAYLAHFQAKRDPDVFTTYLEACQNVGRARVAKIRRAA